MSLSLRAVWIGGLFATFLITTASAAPPAFKEQNRIYGNSVGAGSCNEIENGNICRDVSAWENYDVKGMYDSTEASISSNRNQYNPEDGSYSYGYRYLSCPITRNAIVANPNGATLEAVLDPSAPECFSYGYMESWDPINGYQSGPWLYGVPMVISGQWLDPFNYGESMSNQRNSYFDGWSGVITNTVEHCKNSWADAMRAGGFSINARSWAFDGPDGPAWGNFSLSSCNLNNSQR